MECTNVGKLSTYYFVVFRIRGPGLSGFKFIGELTGNNRHRDTYLMSWRDTKTKTKN